jgi:hypothetical protein
VVVGLVIVGACVARARDDDTSASQPAPTPTATPTRTLQPPKSSGTPTPWYVIYDPAKFAPQVRRSAKAAGINPQLLMAILYNEEYKPHDPSFERSWAQIDSDPAFGIANMHKPAFDETKRGRDFAKRKWDELPDDPALAIEAAAWHLHDLGRRLPDKRSSRYTLDELLALGYNAGSGNMRLFAKGTKAGPHAQSYLDNLHDNWEQAGQAIRS